MPMIFFDENGDQKKYKSSLQPPSLSDMDKLNEESDKYSAPEITSKMKLIQGVWPKETQPTKEEQMNWTINTTGLSQTMAYYCEVANRIQAFLKKYEPSNASAHLHYKGELTATIADGVKPPAYPIFKKFAESGYIDGPAPKNWHRIVRDVLNKLADANKIRKFPVSSTKHFYKLTAPWDPNNIVKVFDSLDYEFNPEKPNFNTDKGDDDDVLETDDDGNININYSPINAKTQTFPNKVTKEQSIVPPKSAQNSEEIEKLKKRVSDLEQGLMNAAMELVKHSNRINDLEEIAVTAVKKIEITIKTEKKDEVVAFKDTILPKEFSTILTLAKCRKNIMLVGPSGCGKSFVSGLVAKALKLPFASISCTTGMSETHFVGRSTPNLTNGKSVFQTTEFINTYEKGGVFLFDELDAADPNLLLVINTALANDYCNLPFRTDKPKAIRHKDFIAIATANTMGRGAGRMYVGRNQLDESTIDRFRIGIVECDYDINVERNLCPDKELLSVLHTIRNKINESGVRRVMSTRFIQDAYSMRSEANWTIPQIVETYTSGWTEEEQAKVIPSNIDFKK